MRHHLRISASSTWTDDVPRLVPSVCAKIVSLPQSQYHALHTLFHPPVPPTAFELASAVLLPNGCVHDHPISSLSQNHIQPTTRMMLTELLYRHHDEALPSQPPNQQHPFPAKSVLSRPVLLISALPPVGSRLSGIAVPMHQLLAVHGSASNWDMYRRGQHHAWIFLLMMNSISHDLGMCIALDSSLYYPERFLLIQKVLSCLTDEHLFGGASDIHPAQDVPDLYRPSLLLELPLLHSQEISIWMLIRWAGTISTDTHSSILSTIRLQLQ